jgi:hypothetical protein
VLNRLADAAWWRDLLERHGWTRGKTESAPPPKKPEEPTRLDRAARGRGGAARFVFVQGCRLRDTPRCRSAH